MTFQLSSEDISVSESVVLTVSLDKNCEEEEDLLLARTPAIAPYYPKPKEEFWWVVLGEKETNKLHAIRKMQFKKVD